MTREAVLAVALELESEDRAEVARVLLESLDKPLAQEVESLWLAEADRRLEELRSGQVQSLPGEEVLRRARALRP